MNKIMIAVLIFTILLIPGISSAQDGRLSLNPPPSYYGSITVNEEPATAGTTIIARIGEEERGSITTTESGFYGDDPGATKLWIRGYQNETGSTVTFYVNGVAAQQTAQLPGAGVTQRVDLTFVGVPTPSEPDGGDSGGGGSSDGGSGSSNGTGGITGEPSDNVLKYLTIYGKLIADTDVPYNFSSVPELGVYEILATGKENESDVAIRVELLKDQSKLVIMPPDGTVYKNLNIWAGTDKVKEALIRFRVENPWITSEGLESSSVSMYRWDGSKWDRLETTEITKDASYTYYEAKTYAFSPFTISGLKVSGSDGMVREPGVTQPETSSEDTDPLRSSGELPVKAKINPAIVIGVIIALLAIAAVLYFKRK